MNRENVSSFPMLSLVLGGARSGKSAFAERLIAQTGLARVYLATGRAVDDEMAARIVAHRAQRGAGWRTVEAPLDLPATLAAEAGEGRAVLVDCLTFWLSNLMAAGLDPDAQTGALLAVAAQAAGPVVLVSNEIGFGVVPDNALARRFRDAQGRLNQRAAAAADLAVLVAAGLPLTLKGAPPAGLTLGGGA